ncbi:MAG: PQQ-dependent sugar dehydrogenase [Solirubrobacterales bacterium]
MIRIASVTRTKALIAALLGAVLAVLSLAAASPEAKPKKNGKGERTPLAEQFDVRPLANGFDGAISFGFLPNGRILVAEKVGRIWRVNPGGTEKTLLLDLSAQIQNERERGLEGIEVAADFATSRRVYFVYTYLVSPLRPSGPQALRLSYFQLDANDEVVNPTAPETVVLGKDATRPCPAISDRLDCPASIAATHQGGTVLSDPDGSLWVGYGDSNLPQSPGNQVFRTYNPKSTAGKLLHIDSNGNGLKGHPFCRKTKNLERTCTKVYARGFRNPFRFILTPGGRPIVADVGWNEREEINLVKKGRNYGWPCMEGSIPTPFYSEKKRCQRFYREPKQLEKPIHEYRNNVELGGAAVIMGPQHQSPSYPPGLDGAYFFGDYASRFIKEGVLRKGKLKGIRTVATDVFPVQFRVAPNGSIAYVDFLMGSVNELVYSNNEAPTAVASASPESYCPPANATAVKFSAAGSSDPEGGSLNFKWDFESNGSVDATGSGVSHVYPSDGIYTATLRASDGAATSTATVRVFAGNCPPSFSLQAPAAGSKFSIGTPVPLQANGTDNGPLGAGGFKWNVILVHKDHVHEVGTFLGTATEFDPVSDHDADSHYEVTLSVTDSSGYTLKLPPRVLEPETVRVRLRTNIGKVKLSYGGRTVKAPSKFDAAVGFHANLSAPKIVRKGGRLYRFNRWKQGGKRSQVFVIPARKGKLVAKYKRVG